MASEVQKNNRTLFSALSIAFLDNFGLSIVFIMFAPLILDPSYGFFSAQVDTSTKNILLGVLIGAFPILTFFGAPFWGDYADRFGRKRALLFTIIGTLLGHALCGVAILFQSYTSLLIARAMAGFFSGNISICLATISDLSHDPKIKGRNIGILTVAMGFGWIVAMLMGGYLSDPAVSSFFSPVLPFAVAAIFTFFGYLIVRFLFTETNESKRPLHFDLMKSIRDIIVAIQHKQSRPYLVMILFWSLGWFFTFQWFTAVSLERFHVSQESASLRLIVLGIIWMLGGLVVNPILVKKFSTSAIALVSIFFTGFFVLLTSTTDQYFIFSFFYWIATIAAPIGLSSSLNIISTTAPTNMQGRVMGFTQSFQALAGVMVPLAGGLLAILDIGSIFPIAGILLLLAFLILLFKNPPWKKA